MCPSRNPRYRGREFFRGISDLLRNSLYSDKSPHKRSFSCKVYSYCLNFPLCNTASALCKSVIRKLILFCFQVRWCCWCSKMHSTCFWAAYCANFAPEMAEISSTGVCQLALTIHCGFHLFTAELPQNYLLLAVDFSAEFLFSFRSFMHGQVCAGGRMNVQSAGQ